MTRMIKSGRMRCTGHAERTVLARKPERKRPIGRGRHRWESNTKMGLREIGLIG
jgi:hypothetical protein